MKEFYEKIIPEPNTGCWLWTGATNPWGYGNVKLKRSKKTINSHRLSWILHRGEIPKKLLVLHKCDTPACVNPEHLWLGTAKQNTQDMVSKKRNRNGGSLK